ncbi:MAG: CRISPR system precrRNA processing endoribonuclease RAMP protein Cas6 [Fusobacterium necrophorum]|nr:CRISPR system precrRNA processing endoribonuclease RAMP protein Cas6 [Fusobacterium necrophorum]
MIRSVVISLKYIGVEEKRILKYQNFNFFQKLFLSLDFQYTELRKIQISNFLTSKKVLEQNQNYNIRICSLYSTLLLKLIQKLFLLSISKEKIQLRENDFFINNILFQHKYSKEFQFHKIVEIPTKVKINFITPTCFKVGDNIFSSLEGKYVYHSLLQSIKKSDFANQYKYFKYFPFDKIQTKIQKEKKVSFYKNYQGMVGEAVYFLDKNSSPKDLWVFYFLSSLSFFSGIGWKTQDGYGQVNVNFLDTLEF